MMYTPGEHAPFLCEHLHVLCMSTWEVIAFGGVSVVSSVVVMPDIIGGLILNTTSQFGSLNSHVK